ncbi:MAG: diaminopimelate decarboxylase family protein [Lachnospiraceae bacterium]
MNKQVQELINEIGTPAFIFDERILCERINYLREKLPEEVKMCYAVKANTFIIPGVESKVERLEICSPGEYAICKKYGVASSQMVISGVNKSENFIEKVVANAIEEDESCRGIFTVESTEHARILQRVAEKSAVKLKVLLRLSSGNQFGMDEEELTEIIVRNSERYPNLFIGGIQYFSGTQKHSIKKIIKEITGLNELIDKLEQDYNFVCEELEYGTGFPVFYFQSDAFDEDEFLKEFAEIIRLSSSKRTTIVEIGRSIAAGCGYYASKVVDVKTVKGQNYAILDGGINQLVYYGQTMAMKHPYYTVLPKRTEGEVRNWNLCGSLCTVNDILVKQLPVADLKIGDVFVFENTGAYSVTEGIALFLSRSLPKVALIKEDGDKKPVRDEIETWHVNS